MEISSIVNGLLILVACLSPFIIIAQIKSSRKNKEIKEFKKYGFKYGIELNEVDKWPNHLIGVDSLKKKLLFVEKYSNQQEEMLIDLSDCKSCEMIRKDLMTGLNTAIDRIQLNFQSKKNNSTAVLTFYDSEKNSAMYFELDLAKKWCDIANNIIQGKVLEESVNNKSNKLKVKLA